MREDGVMPGSPLRDDAARLADRIKGQNGVVLCACGKGQPDDYGKPSTHAMVCTLKEPQ